MGASPKERTQESSNANSTRVIIRNDQELLTRLEHNRVLISFAQAVFVYLPDLQLLVKLWPHHIKAKILVSYWLLWWDCTV
jgi:hypothetical protein